MDFKISGIVKLFPQAGGWHYVNVPKKITKTLGGKTFRGLIPITVTLGSSTWNTSLLPMGDSTHFIALKKTVRDKEKIELGDKVTLSFKVRMGY